MKISHFLTLCSHSWSNRRSIFKRRMPEKHWKRRERHGCWNSKNCMRKNKQKWLNKLSKLAWIRTEISNLLKTIHYWWILKVLRTSIFRRRRRRMEILTSMTKCKICRKDSVSTSTGEKWKKVRNQRNGRLMLFVMLMLTNLSSWKNNFKECAKKKRIKFIGKLWPKEIQTSQYPEPLKTIKTRHNNNLDAHRTELGQEQAHKIRVK